MQSKWLGSLVSWAFHLARKGCALLLVLAVLSGVAQGQNGQGQNGQGQNGQGHRVPEIDPGSIASALTLLGGGVLLLTTRRRRQ